MAAQQTASRTMKSISGAGVLSLGLLLLFVNLDGAVAQISSTLGNREGTPGVLATLGLAGLHTVQEYTFNHDAFLSGLRHTLVSFWPLILIAVGVTMLLHAFKGRSAPKVAPDGSLAPRDRQ